MRSNLSSLDRISIAGRTTATQQFAVCFDYYNLYLVLVSPALVRLVRLTVSVNECTTRRVVVAFTVMDRHYIVLLAC